MLLTSSIVGVVGMNLAALLLVLGRAALFRTRLYRPMLMNIALSVAPVGLLALALLVLIVLTATGVPRPVVLVVVAGVLLGWLLLLPNAGYLITELNLSHRKAGDGVPEWYDVLLVLTLAMSGVLNTLMNVLAVQLVYVAIRYNDEAALVRPEVRALVAGVLLLVSFGIYLGRNLRVNSWDIRHPFGLLAKIGRHLRGSGGAAAAGFTVIGAVFFALMYLVVVGPVIATLVSVG
ncbi:MAG TPA: DUF1361 domain-containing protein [Cellulomonas sp.]